MKSAHRTPERGLTWLELLVAMAMIALLAIVLLPRINPQPSRRLACVSNLKQIGLAIRISSEDYRTNFLMDVPSVLGRHPDAAWDVSGLWLRYLQLTNQLVTPKVLWCPADKYRQPASTFAARPTGWRAVGFTGNSQISYFLGLNASEEQPDSILAGDRNLTTHGLPLGPGRHLLNAHSQLGFSDQLHNGTGNVLLGDASVQQCPSSRLNEVFTNALTQSHLSTNIWLIP